MGYFAGSKQPASSSGTSTNDDLRSPSPFSVACSLLNNRSSRRDSEAEDNVIDPETERKIARHKQEVKARLLEEAAQRKAKNQSKKGELPAFD
jgi:hypothetical protein